MKLQLVKNDNPVTFKIERNGTGYEATLSEGMELEAIVNNGENHLIQVNVKVLKERNPVYTLEVVKVEKDSSKTELSQMKKIAGAEFSLERVDDNELEESLITGEDGKIVLEDLYQYVEGKAITGRYILKEEKAPEGYVLNSEEITFYVTKENNEIKVEIENVDSLTSIKDVLVEEGKITLVVQDATYFRLIKTDSETSVGLANAKFIIYELDEEENVIGYAKDIYGNYVGAQEEGASEDSPYYVYTNSAGEINASLRDGKYKAQEVEAPVGYTGEGVEIFEIKNEEEEESTEAGREYVERVIEDTYVEPERANTIEVEYIEDLLDIAKNMVENDVTYADTKIVLKNDLDFTSESSYRDHTTTAYGDLNGNGDEEALIAEIMNGSGSSPIGFMPIGAYYDTTDPDNVKTAVKPFSGTFDGQNHEIKNILELRQYAGLFGLLRNAVIKNLTISGTIRGDDVGGISAKAIEGVYFENCTNKANIIVINNYNNGAGLIGSINSNILTAEEKNTLAQDSQIRMINCTNDGTFVGNAHLGGLIGEVNSWDCNIVKSILIKNCVNNGSNQGGYDVGGMIGYINNNTVETIQVINCTNNGDISGSDSAGMVGYFVLGNGIKNLKFKNIKNRWIWTG